MRFKPLLLGALALGLALPATATAQDEDEATGMAAYRQAFMGGFGAHMVALSEILTEAPEMVGHAAMHARIVHEQAGHILDVFPEDSTHPASDALPAIWENWDDFASKVEDTEARAAELVEAAETEDPQEIMAALSATGDTCSACHDDYRAD